MSKIYLAFYKKKKEIINFKTLIYRITDDVIRLITKGKYSHCEVAVHLYDNTYQCFSSSFRDKGVRLKTLKLSEDDWDLVDISDVIDKNRILTFYSYTLGKKYDLIGLLSPIYGDWHSKNRYFCSEWCAEALNLPRPHKTSPVSLYEDIIKYKHIQ